ncbi:MAG: hypothetical protein H7343_21135 [Undibacterium sp.]|nr:hypothetical protein [Opitutaceae bacterium]
MPRVLKPCLQVLRLCGQCVLGFCCWTLWLLLSVLLVIQIHILTTNELELPPPLLRAIETRLAASGVHTTFGRTIFDPAGHLLIENVVGTLPGFPEPVLHARAIYMRFNPWAFALGRFEELELHFTGVRLLLPAMLSASGRSEDLVNNLDATFLPAGDQLDIPHLTFELGSLRVAVTGAVHLSPQRRDAAAPLPIADFLAKNYPTLARRLGELTARLGVVDQPALSLVLTPSETSGALATATLTARALTIPSPAVTTGPLRLTTRLPLRGDRPLTALFRFTTDTLTVPSAHAEATHVRALLRAQFNPADFSFVPRSVEFAADSISAAGISLETPVLTLTPQPLPHLEADLVTRVAGLPLAAHIAADLTAQTATVDFNALVGDGLLDLIGARIGHNVRSWIDFPEPVTVTAAHATFAPGWRWEKLTTRLTIPIINAYHVPITDGRAVLELTPTRWFAPEAFGRIGENYARGTYEHDPATHNYRFLLEGRLRPLAISGWFGDWWPDFFQTFLFPESPPPASVEVAGRWGLHTAGESRVIVAAQANAADIRGAHFDYARARLFIRPHFLDALELYGTQGEGLVRGTFTRQLEPVTYDWRRFDFAVTTRGIDLALASKIFGAAADEILAPFTFTAPPDLKLTGRIDSATSPAGAHQSLDLAGETHHQFRFHGFPVERLSFTGQLRDDALTLDRLDLGFAEGTATGRAKVWGTGAARRVGFDYAIKDASLGRAIAILENYAATQRGAPPPPPNRFLADQSNVRLSLAVSAEGGYDDPFSYHGEGSATLDGPALGEVRMLGLLSELFSFTSLRFTSVHANFKLDGARLNFPDLSLTGANSAITGRGTYALDRRTLDFNAKIYPFQESRLFLKSLVGAVLTPFSNVFEVKLSGPLDNPSWAFVIGPTNFFRNLSTDSARPSPLAAPPKK